MRWGTESELITWAVDAISRDATARVLVCTSSAERATYLFDQIVHGISGRDMRLRPREARLEAGGSVVVLSGQTQASRGMAVDHVFLDYATPERLAQAAIPCECRPVKSPPAGR